MQREFNCREKDVEAVFFLARMYSIEPGYIRSFDTFCRSSVLTRYDSWQFNSGYNELEDYVERNGGLLEKDWCVLDFISWWKRLNNGECDDGVSDEER